MEDCPKTPPLAEADEDLIAAAQQILRALESKKNLTDDARKILANLGSQLSGMSGADESKDEECNEEDVPYDMEERLDMIQDKVMNWEKDQSMIWDYGPEEAYEYLKDVNDVRKLIETLECQNLDNTSEEAALLRRAHDVLQTAMARLEEEFKSLLVQNRQPFEPDHMSFRSNEDDILDAGSMISSGDDSVDDSAHRESMGRVSEDYIIELMHQDVIQDLKSIAHLMYESSYGRECFQAFVNAQKDALDECLFILEVEKFSIEDVMKMEWNLLNSKIKRWMRAMKIFVRVYLTSEKLLTDRIFGELGSSASSACFAESSKTAILQLLNFGEAVAIGPHQPEKLIRILDMYEVLADLFPEIVGLYSEGHGAYVRTECQDVLNRLGDCAKATFVEFENAVATNPSANAFPGGGVHPLTRYVLNYIKTLTDYSKTLNMVLKDQENETGPSDSPAIPQVVSEEEKNIDECSSISPMAAHFRSLVSALESNLDEKSKLYKDDPQKHFFLMNNVHYMAEKVKDSELRTVLGDEWVRRHNGRFQKHAMNYERATWSSILALLCEEGIHHPVSSTVLKRLQSFYLGFEEVYKCQTAWSIRDSQLRDDLRISTTLKVIQAYRIFVGRHSNQISEKHVKYTTDDLEGYILHLFQGSQKSLHGYHRRLS